MKHFTSSQTENAESQTNTSFFGPRQKAPCCCKSVLWVTHFVHPCFLKILKTLQFLNTLFTEFIWLLFLSSAEL